ncbi:MAG: glycoside hydrolase family 57 protein [Pseudomonadota bacterium]
MANPVNLVLCWHMHQPYYKEGLDGEYRLPWVYLHGIKDYADMAAHLENNPRMRTVVNFAPILLEQLDDYSQQLGDYLADGAAMRDPLLNMLAGVTPIPADSDGRQQLISACRRAHGPRMIDPYKHFSLLSHIFDDMPADLPEMRSFCLDYLHEQFFIDLLMWYHIAWLGCSLKQSKTVKSLMTKGKLFSQQDRRVLVEVIYEAMSGLIPRYRQLADKGQIELSMSPYAHPIIPLLNDFGNMGDAQPDDPTPENREYPGGKARSSWHLQHGIKVFENYFGRKPKGVWLSEGGLSNDAIEQLDAIDIDWTASGEALWKNSCIESTGCDPNDSIGVRPLFMPYRLNDLHTRIYFRDDGLSDLIGFEYSTWHADDAVADFVKHVETIADGLGKEAGKHVISVILDGENAWEYYPNNGRYFIDALYKALIKSNKIKVRTFADMDHKIREEPLTSLVAGSWVYGTFSTWIGSNDKNRAWDLLVEAKQIYDDVMARKRFRKAKREHIEKLLAICESSDWFWWFGDYNPSGSVSDFDNLFRLQLKKLYQLLATTPPPSLDTPISVGGGDMENAGTMQRGSSGA